jgi:hypothetical protein
VGISFSVSYPAAPRVVLEILTDRRFYSACAVALGALEHETDVRRSGGSWSTDTRLVVPTTGIPYVFEPLVGAQVPIRLARAWTTSAGDGYECAWEVTAQVRGATAHVEGTASLGTTPDGTRYLAVAAVGEVTVPVPLRPLAVSGVEALCRGALANEADLALEWIARRAAEGS